MRQEDEIRQLKERLREALEQLKAVLTENQGLKEQLVEAQKRITELEKQKTPPPAFVKANVAKPEDGHKKPRKKRDAKHNRARRREEPTRIVEHQITSCPVCSSRLGGVSVARRRQVIEVPPPPPIEVTEHVVYHGWCRKSGTWREAPLDVRAQVMGQGRMGVRLTSVIAYLRTVMRLPVRQIQAYLAALHGLKISSGEIVELLHRAKAQLHPLVAALKQEIRASPAVQADETGWREDGKNGYIWSVNTPWVRYYEYHHSRGHEVVETLLGTDFQGVLGSDFYASYNVYAGLHQRMPGCICYATATNSKSSIPMTPRCNSGPRTSKRSMTGPSPTQVLTGTCLRPSKRPHGTSNSTPSSRTCGTCVRPTHTRPRPCIRCVSASNGSYRNCSSLSPCQGFRHTITWRNAVCARWSSRVKSVGARAAPTAPRRVWRSSASLVPGLPRDSIRFSAVWLCLPNPIL